MTFILRWPAVLVLLAAVLMSAAGALGAAGVIANYQVPLTGVEAVDAPLVEAQQAAAQSGAAEANWIDIGLLSGAAVFFLISAIRLMRRTQAFFTWLLGFACFAGRWAYAQGDALMQTVQSIDIDVYRTPQTLLSDVASTEAQVALLALLVLVGLIALIVDGADRSYWRSQET